MLRAAPCLPLVVALVACGGHVSAVPGSTGAGGASTSSTSTATSASHAASTGAGAGGFPAGGKICYPTCNVVADCPTGEVWGECFSGRCVECATDADCTELGMADGCDLQNHTCRGCKDDAECAGVMGGTGKCGDFGCNGCATDAECAALKDPQQALCVHGSCVACRTTADCAGQSSFACDQTVGFCTGCATDQDCCVTSGVTPCPLTCDVPLGHCECQTAGQCQQAFPTDGVMQGCF